MTKSLTIAIVHGGGADRASGRMIACGADCGAWYMSIVLSNSTSPTDLNLRDLNGHLCTTCTTQKASFLNCDISNMKWITSFSFLSWTHLGLSKKWGLLLWSFNVFVIFYFHFFFLLFFFKAASQVPVQSDWSVFSKIWERTTNIDLIVATTLNSRTLQKKAVTWVGGFPYSYKSWSSSIHSVFWFDVW